MSASVLPAQPFAFDGVVGAWSPTAYDDQIVGGLTGSVSISAPGGPGSGLALRAWLAERSVAYCKAVVEPENLDVKRCLHEAGFYVVNSTAEALFRHPRAEDFSVPAGLSIETEPDAARRSAIVALGDRVMRHGRFHEDANMRALVERRQHVIMAKQMADPACLFQAGLDARGELCGYTIYRLRGREIELIAMGIDTERGVTGLGYWSASLRTICAAHAPRRIRARFTLTNIGVLNIYVRLQALIHAPKDEFAWIPRSLPAAEARRRIA